MKAKLLRYVLLPIVVISTACWWASPAFAGSGDEPAVQLKIDTGLMWGNTSDNPAVPGEYFTFDDSPRLTFALDSSVTAQDWFAVTRFSWDHVDDNDLAVDFGWKDQLFISLDHQEFRHRMVQDPMNLGVVVDFPELQLVPVNPDVQPGTDLTETNVAVRYTLPGLRNLTLHGSYGSRLRSGNLPVYSLNSHASTWSVYGTATPIDQLTQDYTGGATWKIGRFVVDDTYSYRRFDARDTADTLIPGLEQPFSDAPDFKKWQNNLSTRVTLPHHTTVFANYVTYNVDNWYLQQQMGVNGMSYDSFQVQVHSILTRRLQFRGYYRTESTDNDVTKWYNPAVPSALSRDVDTYGASLIIRPYSGASVKVKYENREIDRLTGTEDPQVHPNKTSRDRYQVTFSSHLMKKARVRLEWRRDEVDNPFANLRYASEALNYGETYPELSSLATTNDRYRAKVDVSLTTRTSGTIEFEYGDASYDTTAGTAQWDEDYTLVTLTLNFVPTDKLGFYIFLSNESGDATTWLAPDLSDFEFVQDGVWTTGKVPYSNDFSSIGAGFNFNASHNFDLTGTISYVDMSAGSDTALLVPFGLTDWDAYSNHDSNYLNVTVNADYRLDKALSIGFRLGYGDYQDDSIYVRDLTGSGFYGVLSLSWRN